MNEMNIAKLRFRARIIAVIALLVGILIGVFLKDPIINAYKNIPWATQGKNDYDIEEIEVDYLQMLEGVKGISFEVVNGIKCTCKCDDAYPEGELVVYKFHGYIGDDDSKKVQKMHFNYVVKPFVSNGRLSLSGGEISQVLLEPENLIVNPNGMKSLLEAFAVSKFRPFEQYVPNGAFAIKELYSKMVVIKVSKEKNK